jgi:hypothetical protein
MESSETIYSALLLSSDLFLILQRQSTEAILFLSIRIDIISHTFYTVSSKV